MANMSDPRVIDVLAHARACQKAKQHGEIFPDLPSNLIDLSGIDLSDAWLNDANLTDANLTGANLNGAKLNNADLYKADLTNANLSGADLSIASLWKANLTGANLTGANLEGADLNNAQTGFADLTDAKITQIQLKRVVHRDVAKDGYPKEVAEKVILLHEPPTSWKRTTKKRLVVELRADGKLHIKNRIFEY